MPKAKKRTTAPGRTKFNTRKITDPVTGEIYDSAKERQRHIDLLFREAAGEISGLARQQKFCLLDPIVDVTIGPRGGRHEKVIQRGIYYVADFCYCDQSGTPHVEDVKGYKGKGAAWEVFKIKSKLFRARYGYEIEVV